METFEKDGITHVVLSGRLDTAGATKLEVGFTAAVVTPNRPAVVDLSGVTFIASLGVRLLFSTARGLSRRNAKMAVFGACGPVRDVLDTVSLAELVPVAVSEKDAIAAVRV